MRSYLSDEELTKLIESIEQAPLYAPRHLKEEIMKSWEKQDIISVQKLRQAKIQMFSYSMKIIVGMTAALFLTFMLPRMQMDYLGVNMADNRWQETFQENDKRFSAVLQKGTDAINSTSDVVFNALMSFERLFEKEE